MGILGITGIATDALLSGGSIRMPVQVPMLATGFLSLNAAASNSGQIGWDLWYLPLDIGAQVVAV